MCDTGPNAIEYVEFPIKGGGGANPPSKRQCLQPHSKMHCIRENEYTGFLHAPFLGTKRSASMHPNAVNYEADPGWTASRETKCMGGCGNEGVLGGTGQLDFWNGRKVDIWRCGGRGFFARGDSVANNFEDYQPGFLPHGRAISGPRPLQWMSVTDRCFLTRPPLEQGVCALFEGLGFFRVF